LELKMSRGLAGSAFAAALVASAASALAQEVLPCRSRSINVEHASYVPESKDVVGFLCAQGSPAGIHLEVHQTTITAVLSALRAAYRISYRSSIDLNETRDGVYVGSLREVMSHLLSNYNYVIRLDHATLDIDIFGRKGAHAIAAPAPAVAVNETPTRRVARASRTR
jgi:hypothetical protein